MAGVAAGDVSWLSLGSPVAVIESVRSGAADIGCVPVESSLEGSVPATMDALVPETEADRVQIFAETVLDIAFTIAAAQSVAAADVATIAAYPVAAGQVRASLAALFPNAEVVPPHRTPRPQPTLPPASPTRRSPPRSPRKPTA